MKTFSIPGRPIARLAVSTAVFASALIGITTTSAVATTDPGPTGGGPVGVSGQAPKQAAAAVSQNTAKLRVAAAYWAYLHGQETAEQCQCL